jgi:hypothetical protein
MFCNIDAEVALAASSANEPYNFSAVMATCSFSWSLGSDPVWEKSRVRKQLILLTCTARTILG